MAGPGLSQAPVIILGTGGFAVELAAQLPARGRTLLGFLGPDPAPDLPAPWLGPDEVLAAQPPEAEILIAVGKAGLRRSLADLVEQSGRRLAVHVHPAAWVAPDAQLAPGVVVYPNATVHARCRLGRGVLVNSNASVGHECDLGEFATIGPGVALGGQLKIGAEVYFGIGSACIENVAIAAGTIIGAGATVTGTIAHAGTYVGTPARRMT